MKRKFTALLALTGVLISANVQALNYQGFVTVSSNSTYEYMYGTYNVGTNPRAGHADSYILSNTTGIHGLSFSGYDAVNGRLFSCTAADWLDLAVWETALRISTAFNDGSYLYARKLIGSNECDYLYMSKPSYYQR